MSDCYLAAVLGFERSCDRYNVRDAHNTRKSKSVIDPRERIGRVMRESKGEILSDERRTSRSKAWKRAIVGDKFIYNKP